MRPKLVLVLAPVLDHFARLVQGEKPVLVQALVAKLAVEALHEGVLSRLPGLDEAELDAVPRRPMRRGPSR